MRLEIMVTPEVLSTQSKFGIRRSLDVQLNLANRERPLWGKIALVTEISQDTSAEIAIWLSEKGAQIIGIVGNSRKKQEEAKKVAIHIDYNGGWMDLVDANLNTSEGREKARRRVEEVDILVFSSLVTEGNNTLIDGFIPYIREGGKIILVGHEDEAMESLRQRLQLNPEFNKKDISFFVVCPPVERIVASLD